MNFSAIVFDVDGTILDTRDFILRAFEHTLSNHGIPVPEHSIIKALVGTPLEYCYALLAPEFEYGLLRDTHRLFQHENMKLIKPYPDTIEVISCLRDKGIKIGVCSTRAGTLVESLEYAGLIPLLDTIVDGDMVSKNKPDPEGVFLALHQMNSLPHEACMVGDTAVDICAGKNAGTKITIGITHGFGSPESLHTAGADYVVPSLVGLKEILQLP